MTNFGQSQPGNGGGFGSPFGDPFAAGGQHQGGYPGGGFAPPPPPPPVQHRSPTVKPGGILWPMVSVAVGIVGVALVLVPFYTDAPFWLGLIGAAVGLAGLAAGVVGILQARRAAAQAPALAVSGVVAAGVAVVLAVSLVLIQVNSHDEGPAPASSTAADDGSIDDVDLILRDQLKVTFGEFEYTTDDRLGVSRVKDSKLPVTFHNKLDTARDFSVHIAGFADEDTQLADSSGRGLSPGTLEANATTTVDYFTLGVTDPDVAERLKSAEFRVLTAWSRTV